MEAAFSVKISFYVAVVGNAGFMLFFEAFFNAISLYLDAIGLQEAFNLK